MLTPATVHHDLEAAALAARHAVMLAAYSANPDRFAAGEPKLAMLPAEVGSTSQTTTSSPRDHTTSPPLLASERLTCSALDPLDPKWSPHGSSIALVRARDLGSDGGYGGSFLNEWVRQRTLWLQNSDGTGAHQLDRFGSGVYWPQWSRDGRRILVYRDGTIWLGTPGNVSPKRIAGGLVRPSEFGSALFALSHGNASDEDDPVAWIGARRPFERSATV